MKYNYVIFDFDGTLFDSRKGIVSSIKYALNYMKIPVPSNEVLTSFIGPPLLKTFQNHFGLSEADSIKALTKLRDYYSEKGVFDSEPYAGILELLEKLNKNDFPIAIATAKPTYYANQILEHNKWQHLFKTVRGSDMNSELFPKSRTISEAMTDLSISKYNNVVMVGDTIYDIKGATECNIASIAVNYGYGKTQDLKDAKPTHFVENVEELASLLV
ncbi:MAG: HAD hydrolase-like protein [Chitinophagales bacterium]|nr:HAD hydrolase-like protein [Bacteroidota bacterium]MCB9225670.1 HAD hydrolase-like protein [Chitinophagales bacterium]